MEYNNWKSYNQSKTIVDAIVDTAVDVPDVIASVSVVKSRTKIVVVVERSMVLVGQILLVLVSSTVSTTVFTTVLVVTRTTSMVVVATVLNASAVS
jgi:hypothetical protein